MRIDELGTRLQDLGIGAGKPLLVEPFQPRDLAVLGGNQLLPVERAFADRPAEAGCILEMFVELRSVDEELLRHAAADHAGAAVAVFLGDRHLLAERGCDARAAHAPRTAADDEEVVVEGGHDDLRRESLRGWFTYRSEL